MVNGAEEAVGAGELRLRSEKSSGSEEAGRGSRWSGEVGEGIR
jgi:hypothetical protein